MESIYDRCLALQLIFTKGKLLPKILPFRSGVKEIRNFIKESRSFYDLFYGFANYPDRKDGIDQMFNFQLSSTLYENLKFKRKLGFKNFMPYLSKEHSQYGGIIMVDLIKGYHYVYRISNISDQIEETGPLGLYFEIGYFKNNTLLGFEEGYLQPDGEPVSLSGYYDQKTALYGYIGFIGGLFRHTGKYDRIRDLPNPKDLRVGNFKYVIWDESDE